MIDFVYNHDEEVAQFVAQLAPPAGGGFGRCKTIGVIDEEGRLIAGLVYFNYEPTAEVIEIGVASIVPRWFTRQTFRRMFEYPFVECGCQMLYCRVRAENERLLSELARINFNLTMVPRMYGRTEDGVLCTYTDDQWLDCRLSERIYRDIRAKKEAA
jgi:RimJ/RimL family protein N-acetyltransferase